MTTRSWGRASRRRRATALRRCAVGTPKATSSEAGGTTVAMATLLLPELRHVDAKGA
jgi:hypothetical protein